MTDMTAASSVKRFFRLVKPNGEVGYMMTRDISKAEKEAAVNKCRLEEISYETFREECGY